MTGGAVRLLLLLLYSLYDFRHVIKNRRGLYHVITHITVVTDTGTETVHVNRPLPLCLVELYKSVTDRHVVSFKF